jgi:mono/diheme cytochrome c family protein
MTMSRGPVFGLAIGLALLALSMSALAQQVPGTPDKDRGQALAERLCTNCHLVGVDQAHANVDVPSFAEIANRPGQTSGTIIGHIILPKHPMPQIPLERDELADLAAYILSLRDRP